MKTSLITCFITIFLFTNNYAQINTTMEKVNSILKEVKEKFAPDKRVAIFIVETNQHSNKFELKGETNLPEAKKYLEDALIKAGVSVDDNINLLPSKELDGKTFGIINLSAANIRSDSDHPAELATQAILGTPVKILKKGDDGYYLIQTPDGYIAWLDDDGFAAMNEKEFNDWLSAEKIIYTNDFGFSYSSADQNSQRVSDLVIGNILKLNGEENNFYSVVYPDGRKAFIKKDEAKMFKDWYASLNPNGETILQTAYRFMGVPYLWGGTSAKGMDCSGFTKTVYFLNGIILPRDASQQVNAGDLIDTKDGWQNLQAGDLLFFGSKAKENRKEKITHVAIYIGDGDFIHAAGRVRINSLNASKSYFSNYRNSSFIRAKRMLNTVDKGTQKILENSFYKSK